MALTSMSLAVSRTLILAGVALALNTASAGSARAQQNAIVGGILLDHATRFPIEGARVNILGTSLRTNTDSSGRFNVAGVPAGVRVIQVRAVGYAVGSWMVELGDNQRLDQVFELEGRALTVDSVTVIASNENNWRSEEAFERRRQHGATGYFLTRDDIRQRRAESLSDLIRVVPGVFTSCRGRNCQVLMPAGTRPCAPEYFLDGYPATFATGPSFPMNQIRGVEVYRSRFEVPTEFQRPNLTCGVIAIWTIDPGTRLESH